MDDQGRQEAEPDVDDDPELALVQTSRLCRELCRRCDVAALIFTADLTAAKTQIAIATKGDALTIRGLLSIAARQLDETQIQWTGDP